MFYLGTSGFSYDDWASVFYPPGMPKREWLLYYAHEFNTCEINSTYYAVPQPSTMKGMAEKTGDGFLFSVKANQEMTHQRQDNSAVFAAFRVSIEPLLRAGKLGCVLAQFPYSFHYNKQNLGYLEAFQKQLGDLPLVIEFRNVQWLRDEVFQWLRQHELGFCCVDEPCLPNLLPPVAEATSDIAYVRFHGRNAAKWWQHEQAYERYDYTYTADELSEWVPRIKKLGEQARATFIFANNHWRGQSIDTIRQIRRLLD